MKKLKIVDAHHHFWNLSRNYYPWLQDTEEKHFFLGDYRKLKKNYLPQDYLRDASNYDILATVHVEAEWDRNDQVGETKWLQEINKQFGMPNAIVGHVWLGAKNCEEVLYKHRQFELFRGVRAKPETALTSHHTKPTGIGSMHDPNWRMG